MEEKFNIIECIDTLSKRLGGSKLDLDFIQKNHTEIRLLSDWLGVTENQAMLFCSIFSMSFEMIDVSLCELMTRNGWSLTDMTAVMKDLKALETRGLIFNATNDQDASITMNKYIIRHQVAQQLFNNEKVPPSWLGGLSTYEIIDETGKLIRNINNRLAPFNELMLEFNRLLTENSTSEFVTTLTTLVPDEKERLFFCHLCFIEMEDDCRNLQVLIDNLFHNASSKHIIRRKLLSQSNTLVRNQLVEIVEDQFFMGRDVKLGSKGWELLDNEVTPLHKAGKVSHKSLRSWEKLPETPMYYNEPFGIELDQLTTLLTPESFHEFAETMKQRGRQKGISVLLYGEPGTGKTETVCQMARTIKRDIFWVDISEMKHCYFGESEKRIKQLFDEYDKILEKHHPAPILFFNEADAIFSKRRHVEAGSAAITENAMQNIILEEMEHLNGILIATTNLTINLDKAFDRRFLFKLKFDKPNVEVLGRIWKSKIPHLTTHEIKVLQERFDITGAQIENVARKAFMHEMLHKAPAKLQEIMKFAAEEANYRSIAGKIGFSLSGS
jgi:hypothetical protein